MTAKVTGLAEVRSALLDLGPREAKNLMRTVVFDMAKQIAVDAADRAPSDQGDLKAGIKPKRERGAPNLLAATVRASPFYWRYLEYGQGPDGVEHAFFLKTLQALRPDIDAIYLETFVRKWTALMARKAKRKGA